MVGRERAVFLDAPEDLLFRRVDGRLIHVASGRTYHPLLRPPKAPKGEGEPFFRDDVTGEALEERWLDKVLPNREAFAKRMDVEFNGNVLPLIDWYEQKSLLKKIYASGDVEDIHAEIVALLRGSGYE